MPEVTALRPGVPHHFVPLPVRGPDRTPGYRAAEGQQELRCAMCDAPEKLVNAPYTVEEAYEEDPQRPDEFGRKNGAWVYTVDHPWEGVVFQSQVYREAARRAANLNNGREVRG